MLDIYYADFDTTFMPLNPGCLELAGSIDLDAHRLLAALFDKAGRLARASATSKTRCLNPRRSRYC
ncbi:MULTISPECIES: hypothetical protein [Agrobacterium tumefaciens complex]|uniref:hypothetical protein n=1 Tax=Agrobacterium tumefaciens complex TaxID=1183400 RepID=UPI001E5358BA|nr:hypothetical protein [Agrobacterium tumefaciens]MDR6591187.1 hypothetical protein [Agrobacterium tumefaciens]